MKTTIDAFKRKRRERVPFLPEASLCVSSSGNQIYHQISLPKNGTIHGIGPSSPEVPTGDRFKRVSFCAFSSASITVEAAIALPLLFMCVICIISMIDVYGKALDRMAALRDTAQTAALVGGSGSGATVIDLNVPFVFTPYFLPEGTASAVIPCRACARAWNGRDEATAAEGQQSSGEFVYVTDYQSVYHTSASCTHLDLSIHGVSAGSVWSMRNDYGGSYHACEKCAAAGTGGTVYVTSYGDCYHTSAECSGLKRSVKLIDRSELGSDLCVCSRCATKAG